MVAILVLLTIITCLTIDYFAERAKLRSVAWAGLPAPDARLAAQPISVRTPIDLTQVPAGAFIGPGHAWMQIEPTGDARVGVDRLPIVLLGGIDEIEAAPPGTEIHQGDRLARLRQGEHSIEVKSPVDGTITAVNSELKPAVLEAEPFADGWLVKLAPRELGPALRRLFVADEARQFLRNELANLRDYLAGLSLAGHPSVAMATLPDGGLPVEGLAKRMSDEEWRELVERFF